MGDNIKLSGNSKRNYMGSTADTRANNIAEKVKRLTDWLKVNKPDQKLVHIYREDYQWLKTKNPAAMVKGFYVDGDKVTYDGFELVPHET